MNHKTERDEALAKWQRECEGDSVPVTAMMRHAYRHGWDDALACQSQRVPQAVIDALRFYANGHHYSIDDDHQQFDAVSGEPQNWLMSEKDDDCTMIEDGSIAKAALCGGVLGFEEPTQPVEGEVLCAAPSPDREQVGEALGLSYQSCALLLNVLWHHQGGSSTVGQPIRTMLGIGQYDHLTEEQLSEAKRIEGMLAWHEAPDASPSRECGERQLSDERIVEEFEKYSKYGEYSDTEIIKAVRALLSASAAHNAGAQKPVAWMYQSEDPLDGGEWFLSDTKPKRRNIRPLYAHPQPMPQTDAARDAKRMDWLCEHTVNVRDPLPLGGSHNMFWVSPNDDDGGRTPSNLREKIDAEIERLDRAKGA